MDDAREIFQLSGEIQFDDSVILISEWKRKYTKIMNRQKVMTQEPGMERKEGVKHLGTGFFSRRNTTALKNGTNCIAVEVHQIHEDSSDVYFDFKGV